MTDLNSHEPRRQRPPYPGDSPYYPPPLREKESGVFVETLTFKAVTVVSLLFLIIGGTISAVAAAMSVQKFLSQNESFRSDIIGSIQRLTQTVEKAEAKLNDMTKDPDFVRMRDLSDFCLIAERENPSWKCPIIYQLRPGSIHQKTR